VPFYVRTGKRLPRRLTEVVLQFQRPPHLPIRADQVSELKPDALILRIQPDEGITLRFGAKVPGHSFQVRSASMEFSYQETFKEESPEAYERLLLDALIGDPTLFIRSDEVEQCWRIVDPIVRHWQDSPDRIPFYEAASWGPDRGRPVARPRRPRLAQHLTVPPPHSANLTSHRCHIATVTSQDRGGTGTARFTAWKRHRNRRRRPDDGGMAQRVDCDLLCGRGGRGWVVGRCHGRLARPDGRGRGEGAGLRRRHGLVRRLDVGAAQPAVAGRRDRGGPWTCRARTCGHVLGDNFDAARVDALLAAGPHMVAFFQNRTSLQFVSGTWIADIQGHVPVPVPAGGRWAEAVQRRRLRKELRVKLRPPLYETSFLGMGIMAGPDLRRSCTPPGSARASPTPRGGSGARRRPRPAPARHATGQRPALIARLMKSADDLGVELRCPHRRPGCSPRTGR
jgi:hypothetical protein